MESHRRKGRPLPFILAAALLFASGAAAQGSKAAPVPAPAGTTHATLPNGLEVFVVENHAVPLVTVCLAFRGGAIAHTPETAGLFHLYEHMMFTGNEKYPSQAAFNSALKRMGVPNYNGATGNEYINYYITVPSDKVGEGIEFWSWAAKKPVFTQEKLDAEKGVVLSEIQGYHNDPDSIYENAIDSRIYSAFPWRKNIDGPDANIQNATLAQLQDMRARFYIPRNTALFIGGDVKPEAAVALAQKWFGDWTGGPAPVVADKPQAAFPVGLRLVYPDSDFYQGIAEVDVRWRGPDVLRQTKDTYTSDVFSYLISSPAGRFKQAIMNKCPGLYDERYIDFGYPTRRDGGAFEFSTYMRLQEPSALGASLDRAVNVEKAVREELALIAKDPAAYFTADELAKAKAKVIDINLLASEVAENFVTDTLTFWWSVASTDYFFGYEANCSKVSFADISDLITRYLASSPDVLAVRILSDDFDGEEGMADKVKALGFAEVGPTNAFWWQK
jgi:zinc protease